LLKTDTYYAIVNPAINKRQSIVGVLTATAENIIGQRVSIHSFHPRVVDLILSITVPLGVVSEMLTSLLKAGAFLVPVFSIDLVSDTEKPQITQLSESARYVAPGLRRVSVRVMVILMVY
jgi:hypothetical protein